jgi:4-aminobutyrate aminotransferase-like enzyme
VVRLLAPLTIQDGILAEGLDILAASLRAACGTSSERAVA